MLHGKSHHKKAESHHSGGEPQQHPDQPAQNAALASPEVNHPQPPSGNPIPGQPKRDWFDYSKFALQAIGLLVLIAYTIYAGLQWSQMRKAVKAAEDANVNAQRAFSETDRATLVIDTPTEFLSRKLIKVRVRNIGKRVAGPFWLWIVASRWKSEEPRPIEAQKEQLTARPDARRIPPDGYLDFVVTLAEATDSDIGRIDAGTERLMILIQADYDDGFAEQRSLSASFEYDPKIGWSSNTPVYGTNGQEKLPNKKSPN